MDTYVLQLFQRLELNGAVSCEQTLSGVYCVWTEAFFGIAFAFYRMGPRGAGALRAYLVADVSWMEELQEPDHL